MRRGPLYRESYRPRLSGHETFPLRYGWLKKAFDAVEDSPSDAGAKSVFLADDAIARFGVGKNMVASIRHWANATGVLDEDACLNGRATTPIGNLLFGREGVDPYFEHPATAWLIHWQLAGCARKTTWHWAFNYYPSIFFDREQLASGLLSLARDRGWRAAPATIKTDVACFIRTYVSMSPSGKASHEDVLESPLTELGLVKPVGKRDGFRFVRGNKPSLGHGMFCYAITDFWSRFSAAARTLSLEAIAHEPGSPGRVFLLDENSLAARLAHLEESSSGLYRWSETAGLKQLEQTREMSPVDALEFVSRDYP